MLKFASHFVGGLLVANAFEWAAHKYILHGTPRKGQPRYSPSPASMNSHWTHHRMVRKTQFADECYEQGLAHDRTRLELLYLGIVATAASGIVWLIPRGNKGMMAAFCYSAGHYFYVHQRAHLEPEWAKKRIPWHYDHHMNTIQDANWCVTRPWFDYLMGTREASSRALIESNPLGVSLPQWLEQPLNTALRGMFPQVFARVEGNILQEEQRRVTQVDDMPEAPLQQVA